MDFPLLSTVSDAPPGFEYRQSLHQRDLRLKPFALFTDDHHAFLERHQQIKDKVYGVLITRSEGFRLKRIARTLWLLEVRAGMLPSIRDYTIGFLETIDSFKSERKEKEKLQIEFARAKSDIDGISDYISIVDERMRRDFNVFTDWLVTALSRLVQFAAEKLDSIDAAHYPEAVLSFLVSEDFPFTGAALMRGDELGFSWQCLAIRGSLQQTEIRLDDLSGEQGLWLPRQQELYSRFELGNLPHVLVITCNKPLFKFQKSEMSFVGLLTALIAATWRVKRGAEALSAEKEQLAVTLRSIGDGVITTDIRGRIVLVNQVAELLTGWSQQEARDLPIDAIFRVLHPKSRRTMRNSVEQFLQAREPTSVATLGLLQSRDGQERLVAESATPLRDRTGRTTGMVLVFRDITLETQREKETIRMEKLESLGILAGGIAHDFNNILTSVIANVSLGRSYLPQSHPASRYIGESERAAFRARDLTQQLLTFSRGGAPVKKASSIGELIVESSSFALPGSKARCQFELDPELWAVEVDASQISQVITNLVINAAQAMPRGGTIEVQAQNIDIGEPGRLPLSPGRYVRIAVIDQGMGIPEEVRSKVFDPYFTTKETGTGLGLATAYSIIRQHGGYIGVDSEVGRGSEFMIYLPALMHRVTASVEPQELLAPGEGRILIMDDDEAIREALSILLEQRGYSVTATIDGQAAVTEYMAARQSDDPFELVIFDLTIPGGMGGKEAFEALRILDPAVKGIVCSGYSNDPVMAKYQDYGFRGVLAKPYKTKELLQLVQSIISGQP